MLRNSALPARAVKSTAFVEAQALKARLPATARKITSRSKPSRTRASRPINTRNIAVAAPHDELDPAAELSNLRGLIDSVPFVSSGPNTQSEQEFRFPTGTLFNASSPHVGLEMTPAYARALRDHGIAAIELDFNDPDSQFILGVVDKMGCRADSHSATQGALWDEAFKPEGVKSEGSIGRAHPISHSMAEFDWHTDAAFEREPMRFVGFHILHPDKEGGGIFRLFRAEDLTTLLSEDTVDTLLNFGFKLNVPPEFFKGDHTIRGKLLYHDDKTGQLHVRYRRDLLQDLPTDNAAACQTVNELRNLLDDSKSVGKNIPRFAFKENTVLLIDNARFLHSRTGVKDPRRWLRRVRFRGYPQ